MMRQYLAIKREVPAGAIVMFRLGNFRLRGKTIASEWISCDKGNASGASVKQKIKS